MEQACTDIETEIAASEAETRLVLEDIKTTVGDLSDLRYGRFSKPAGNRSSVGEDIIEGLEGFQDMCRSMTGGEAIGSSAKSPAYRNGTDIAAKVA